MVGRGQGPGREVPWVLEEAWIRMKMMDLNQEKLFYFVAAVSAVRLPSSPTLRMRLAGFCLPNSD